MRQARLAILAQDYLLGRVPKGEHDQAAQGLALEMGLVAFAGGPSRQALPALTWSDVWEVIDTIWGILYRIGGIAVPGGGVTAVGIAIYYWLNPPNPTGCTPGQLDKWQHCFVGCKIAFWVLAGAGAIPATVLAILKEVADAFGMGDAGVDDITATLEGTWTCGFWESCDECCCEKGY